MASSPAPYALPAGVDRPIALFDHAPSMCAAAGMDQVHRVTAGRDRLVGRREADRPDAYPSGSREESGENERAVRLGARLAEAAAPHEVEDTGGDLGVGHGCAGAREHAATDGEPSLEGDVAQVDQGLA